MLAKDLGLALNILTKAYQDAQVYADGDFIIVKRPGDAEFRLNPHLEETVKHLGMKYSDAHGACWYASNGS